MMPRTASIAPVLASIAPIAAGTLLLGAACKNAPPPAAARERVRSASVAGASESRSSKRARPRDSRVSLRSYRHRLGALRKRRLSLAHEYRRARGRGQRASVLRRAGAVVLRGIVKDIFPAWFGTRWDYNGTSQEPGRGSVACGYFVTTVLRDAGFPVRRVWLAQQASERIIRTLTSEDRIWRFSRRGIPEVLARVNKEGPGLFLVGLDNHVGFLVSTEGKPVRFCHSSYLGSGGVACELAASSPAMRSNYHVVGKILSPTMLRRWLLSP